MILLAPGKSGAQTLSRIGPADIISTDSSLASPPPKDEVFGLDKPKHFLLAAFIESSAFSALTAARMKRGPAMISAATATAAFAIGREAHDRKTKGLFSFGDLLWDALGAAAAGAMLRHTYR